MPAAGPLFVFLTEKWAGERASSFASQPAVNLSDCWPDDMSSDFLQTAGVDFRLDFFRLAIIIKKLGRLPGLHAADLPLLPLSL